MSNLFYAYAKQVGDVEHARFLIVFASRAVADEWWRAVSTSPDTAYSSKITRVTPQFYTHAEGGNIIDSISMDNVAKDFVDLVVFTLLDDRNGRTFSMIPQGPDPITDYISYNWFYIRSKSDRNVYWYSTVKGDKEANEGTIVASCTRSTRFRVTTRDENLNGKVMINSDEIQFQLGTLSLNVADNGSLRASGKPENFLFRDLTNGFIISGNNMRQIDGLPRNAIVKVSDGSGEAWELVMNGRVYDE
ncbi:hypothetical protein AAF712_008907 [Marasmius tenuissimus]|uniref:Uncharacterized protein n=1 Tax=Marasmius tenuissimus TaxID=585030 RepID=A0ABR2ZR86_9AGAR